MPRIVLVGAGSVEFTRNLLGDILSADALRDAEIVLHDIDADRLTTAERMARWTAGQLGANPTICGPPRPSRRADRARTSSSTRSRSVARAATQVDFDVPARFGLRYTIADTIGVGGVFRGAAHDPGRARDRPRTWSGLPGCVVPQLHEPDGDASCERCPRRRRSRSSGCATRSSGPSTRWPATWASRARRSTTRRPGVNHLAFLAPAGAPRP